MKISRLSPLWVPNVTGAAPMGGYRLAKAMDVGLGQTGSGPQQLALAFPDVGVAYVITDMNQLDNLIARLGILRARLALHAPVGSIT